MADKKKKGFNAGVYAVASGVIIAVILVCLTIFAFTSRYTAFSPEKTAQYYADVIVQSGDGYNAYKNTLVSKNQKYGDFVINAYMAPFVNDEVEQSDVIGSGSTEEAKLLDAVYSTMYDYFLELVESNGFDNYDALYDSYFTKLAEVRKDIIGDDYMSTEFMFGVFESNVDTYGKSLTGTDVEYEADGKTVKTEATVGKYQEMFGENYKLTTTITDTKELAADEKDAYLAEYKARIGVVVEVGDSKANTLDGDKKDAMLDAYGKLDCSDSIDAVDECTAVVSLDDGTEVATVKLFVVKIGNSWYIDNTNVDTSSLYL